MTGHRRPSALDAAAFILERMGPMSTLKLQKLLYYSQAWSLVWDDAPLFNDQIQAWRGGPVVPNVYASHRGAYSIAAMPGGRADTLNTAQRATVIEVCRFYGRHDGEWLSELTHRETPWRAARAGAGPDENTTTPITNEMLAAYFSIVSLKQQKRKRLPVELERGCDLLLSLDETEIGLIDKDAGEYDPEEMARWLVHGVGRVGSAD